MKANGRLVRPCRCGGAMVRAFTVRDDFSVCKRCDDVNRATLLLLADELGIDTFEGRLIRRMVLHDEIRAEAVSSAYWMSN